MHRKGWPTSIELQKCTFRLRNFHFGSGTRQIYTPAPPTSIPDIRIRPFRNFGRVWLSERLETATWGLCWATAQGWAFSFRAGISYRGPGGQTGVARIAGFGAVTGRFSTPGWLWESEPGNGRVRLPTGVTRSRFWGGIIGMFNHPSLGSPVATMASSAFRKILPASGSLLACVQSWPTYRSRGRARSLASVMRLCPLSSTASSASDVGNASARPAPPNLPGWECFFPLVCSGDMMFCTHGTETRAIKVSPPNRPANIYDNKAVANIRTRPANPCRVANARG